MSNIFRLTINALFELTNEQLVAVTDLCDVLRKGPDTLSNEHDPIARELLRMTKPSGEGVPGDEAQVAAARAAHAASKRTPHQQKLDAETKRVGKEAAKRTRAKNKSRGKDYDPAKVLANRSGPSPRPKPWPRNTQTNGITAKVLDALTQTTGYIGARELAEVLDMDSNKVSQLLSGLFRSGREPRLKRMAAKHTLDNGKTVPGYTYMLEAKS